MLVLLLACAPTSTLDDSAADDSGGETTPYAGVLEEDSVTCDWLYGVGYTPSGDIYVLNVDFPEADRTAATDVT